MPSKISKAVLEMLDENDIPADKVECTGSGGSMLAKDVCRAITRMARAGELISASEADEQRFGPGTVEPDPVGPTADDVRDEASRREADERVAAGGSIWGQDAQAGMDHNARKVSRRRIEEEEREREREESRASSRPWNSENRRRFHVDRFYVAKKKAGWVDRWVLKGNIETFFQEGWELASRKQRGDRRDPRLASVIQQGNGDLYERGDHVLMETPKGFNDDRNRHVQALTAAQATSPIDQAIAAGVSVRDGHFGERARPKRRPRDADVVPVERTGSLGHAID